MTTTDTRHIVIAGSGYAGTLAALRLAGRTRGRARISLVSRDGVLVQRLRLHQVAAGQAVAEPDLRRLIGRRPVEVVRGSVAGIDLDRGAVGLAAGGELGYDRLLLTVGSDTSFEVPGAAEHAHAVASRAAALRLRGALSELRPGARVVVAGGGLTGIEAATELAGARPDVRVALLTAGRPGGWLSDRARTYLERALERRGVELVAGVRVEAVERGRMALAGGGESPFDLAVWCGGFRVPALAWDAGLAVDARGAVLVDEHLRSSSHPEVLAAGDAGAPPLPGGTAYRMTCQAAMPAGAHAADVLAAELAGREPEPFDFGYIHAPVSLGRRDGVVQRMRRDDTPTDRVLTGRTAAFYKEIVSRSAIVAMRLERRMPGATRWAGARAGAAGDAVAAAARAA